MTLTETDGIEIASSAFLRALKARALFKVLEVYSTGKMSDGRDL